MTKKNVHPLVALAETVATPKEVRANLRRFAEAILELALTRRVRAHDARAKMIWALNAYLDRHHFANFSRKRSIDKIVAKTMRDYESKLRGLLQRDLQSEKSRKHSDESRLENLKDELLSSQPGYRWDAYHGSSWQYLYRLHSSHSTAEASYKDLLGETGFAG